MPTQEGPLRAAAVRMQWGVRIPMRDGVHLSATLYLPTAGTAPTPAIVTLTPYVAQTYHDRGTYFAERGYAFLVADTRGRGDSEGEFRPYTEAQDGYDIVEWLAQQSYCNGMVAMWGGSYQGHVQWTTAREFPPHLATIVPVASPYRGIDSPMRNNIFQPYRLQWLHMVAGRTVKDKVFADQSFWNRQFKRWFESGTAFERIDTFLGMPSATLQEWLAHPHLDSYWDSLNPSGDQYSRISIPVLTITGTYDGDQPGALMHYREHVKHNPDACHYLVIGPWNHFGTRTPQAEFGGLRLGQNSVVDLPSLHVQWYAWTMQSGPKPPFLQKKVAYYVMGLEKWRYADTLAAITARSEPLYLQSTVNPTDVFRSGSLAGEPPTSSCVDHYVYDPRDVSLAGLEISVDPENRIDQRLMHASIGKQLVYHSLPLPHDLEISGFFKLSVWLSIDQPDTDFQVSVHEVLTDGGTIQLSTDTLRARYRQSLREPKLVQTTDPLRYDFEHFLFVSRQVRRGNRLRLLIGPIHSIFSQKNHNSGRAVASESIEHARAVTVRLFHDVEHPSALYVPIGVAS